MQYTASHSIVCNAPRARIYALISRSSDWPAVFEPCEAVQVLEAGADFEHIEITARVNGTRMTWQSRRHFLPQVFGIESVLVRPMKLVRAMNTSWRIANINREQCLLILEHDYDLDEHIGGQVEGVHTLREAECFIDAAIDTNSRTELRNIKQAVERAGAAQAASLDRSASHSVVCEAPADRVYAVIRNTANWPRIFDACLSATRLDGVGNEELVRIEAMQDGKSVAWNTQRRYFDAIHRIDYHLPVPMPFLESMQGQWRVVALAPERCLLTVNRSWRMLSDVRGIREGVHTVDQAGAIVDSFVNENAQAEMQAIRSFVEGGSGTFLSFSTTHHLPFDPDAVYSVLADAAAWPDVLPHCESLQMVYDDSKYQEFLMRVRTPRGVEAFRSIRRCSADELCITYFQPAPPVVMRTHHGSWQLHSAAGGTQVTVQHSIELDSAACVAVFGSADTVSHKRRIKELVCANSGATIDACRQWLAMHAAQSAQAREAVHE